MKEKALIGLLVAGAGALVLSPDALLLRLSDMDGFQLVAWRGLLMGPVMICAWLLTSKQRYENLSWFGKSTGWGIILCQYINALLFSTGIAVAPITIVLLGLATVPVFSAIFGWLFLGDVTGKTTWVTILMVMVGIIIAVTGSNGEAMEFDFYVIMGALAGLGVAIVMAMNFTITRANPNLPILLLIGCGAFAAGFTGLIITSGQSGYLYGRWTNC